MRRLLYNILSFLNWLIPKSNKKISIYGRRMLNDNAEVLLNYLIDEKYTDKYNVSLMICRTVWYDADKYNPNIDVCVHPIRTIFMLLRSKYIFHTQGMSICKMKPSKGQVVFNLWHGSPLKAIGRMIGTDVHPNSDTFFLSSSPFFAKINEACFGHSQKQMFIGSNPRNDLLFIGQNARKTFANNETSKIIVFMPTFRNSKGLGRNDASRDFPIITAENIIELDNYLASKDALLIIKPHPYQNQVDFLEKAYKNIRILFNENLKKSNIKLYELLGCSDALITDFSSVYFDYLLLNKPIGFAVDDFEDYKNNRGYTVENPYSIMPGEKIQTMDDFKLFITNLSTGNDPYQLERMKINDLVNTYKTGDACLRILNHLEIKK